jgi:hypothetical protein
LSLANRIKLYYFADPYELGKWASLSAIWIIIHARGEGLRIDGGCFLVAI